MPSTTEYNSTFSARALGNRTDDVPAAVDDLTAEEDRLINDLFSGGIANPVDGFKVDQDTGTNMNIKIGSGSAKADLAIIEGTASGQSTYVVRSDVADTTITLSASDPSNPRIDSVYLIVHDATYDASGKTLPKFAVRVGDPAGSPAAPGPDGAWRAYLHLADVLVGAAEASIQTADITDRRTQAGFTTQGVIRVTGGASTTKLQGPAGTSGSVIIGSDLTDYMNFDDSADNIILGSGWTLDGIDPSSHASRHNPGGADAVSTAAPSQIVPAGSNTTGVSANLARADHGHRVDTAAGTVLDPLVASGSTGVANGFSRSDHTHGVPGDFIDDLLIAGTAAFSPEVTGTALTGTYQDFVTSTISPPGAWNTWKVLVTVGMMANSGSGSGTWTARISIGPANSSEFKILHNVSGNSSQFPTLTFVSSGTPGDCHVSAKVDNGGVTLDWASLSWMAWRLT